MKIDTASFCQRPARVLVLDWFDGPTSGFLDYGRESPLYYFSLITSETSEPRAFALRRSPLDSLDTIELALTALGPPRRPVWVPNWKFPDDVSRDAADIAIASVTPSELPVVGVVVAESLEDDPLAACALNDSTAREAFVSLVSRHAEGTDWLRFCNRCEDDRRD